MKKNKLELRLEVGDEVIYFDGKTLMGKSKVISVDKKDKSVTLDNYVKISRHPNKEGYFPRMERNFKDAKTWRLEDASKLYEAYLAKNQILHNLSYVGEAINIYKLQQDEDQQDLVIKLNKLLKKVCGKVG